MSLKFLIAIIFVHFMTAICFAEGAVQKKIGINVFGGFSYNKHQGVGLVSDINPTVGLGLGLGVDYKVLNKLALTLDILYLKKSYEISKNGTLNNYSLGYIEIPVSLKYWLTPNIALRVGPYLGAFMIGASQVGGGAETDTKDQFNNDFGIVSGLWIGINPKPNLSIGLDARFDLGLADIQNDNDPASVIHTRSYLFLMNVSFLFK